MAGWTSGSSTITPDRNCHITKTPHRIPTHPGEILLEEFLKPMGVTQVAFARHIGIPLQRVNEIVRRKRGVTAATAWLFARALGTTPQLWLNLQSNCDLAVDRPARNVKRLRATG